MRHSFLSKKHFLVDISRHMINPTLARSYDLLCGSEVDGCIMLGSKNSMRHFVKTLSLFAMQRYVLLKGNAFMASVIGDIAWKHSKRIRIPLRNEKESSLNSPSPTQYRITYV